MPCLLLLKFADQSKKKTLEEYAVPVLNLASPLNNSLQLNQGECSQGYEVPCEREYEYVDKKAIAPTKTFTYDYAFIDGPLKNETQPKSRELDYTEEDDYVIKNDGRKATYITVIEPRSDTTKYDTHDDYVVPDKSYVTVTE